MAQLAPGPLAAQLAIYLGYCHYGIPGATLVGIAFALPSFLMVVALGWAYLHYGGLSWMQAVFYGVGASIIGIIARSAQKLTAKNLGKSAFLWLIFLGMALVTFLTEHESIPLILTAGLLAWLIQAASGRWKPNEKAIIGAACILFVLAGGVVLVHSFKSPDAGSFFYSRGPGHRKDNYICVSSENIIIIRALSLGLETMMRKMEIVSIAGTRSIASNFQGREIISPEMIINKASFNPICDTSALFSDFFNVSACPP